MQSLHPVETGRSAATVEFSQITDVDVDSRGRIYVGDRLGAIFVLDGSGALVRRFGRMGGGPGEFELVSTIRVLEQDSLFIYDGSAQRATVYAPQSDRVAYTIRLPQPNFAFAMNVEPIQGRRLIAHFRQMSGDFPGSPPQRSDVIRILNRDGSIHTDSVLVVPEPEIIEIRTEQSNGFFLPPFSRQSLVRWNQDGRIYSLWSDSSQVSIHDAAGRRQGGFSARLPAPPLPLTDATIDSLATRNAGSAFPPRQLRDAFRERWQTWPRVEDMLVDDRARVWIMPVTQTPHADWLAFDTRGTQVAALRLPRTVHPRLIRGEHLYAVSRDSLDVESLVVYRLDPASTPAPEDP